MIALDDDNAAKIRKLILATLPPSDEINPKIYGVGANLDSLGLVNFLADLEYRLGAEYDCEIVLASEQAMSRSRSPFRDVDSLTEYILELITK